MSAVLHPFSPNFACGLVMWSTRHYFSETNRK